jgi:glycosyltransferase involved in cell wall biosynthesis
MKIGFSFIDLAPGGAQNLLVQLAEAIAQRGHEVFFYLSSYGKSSSHRDPFLFNQINSVALQVHHPSGLLQCDVIQVDGYHSLRHKFPFFMARQRCIETIHSLYSLRRSGPLYFLNLVAVSEYIRSKMRQPARVIYNGIHLPEQKDLIEKIFDICILGRIHPVKNHPLFLSLCESLYDKRGRCSAVIIGGYAGDADYKFKIDRSIRKLEGKGISITMTGTIPPSEVYTWLLQSKILIIPSLDEGFGRMAVEGMACSLPVVANPVGGLREIIIEGETGLFAIRNELESFTELSMTLLGDPSLRERMGIAGQKRAKDIFSFERMVNAYEELYTDVLRRKV